MNEDDDLLLKDVKAGLPDAFERVFERYYKSLTIEAYHLLGDAMEGEDVVQNIFIELWDKKYYEHITVSLRSYLRTSLRNKCLTRLSQGSTHSRHLDAYTLQTEMIYHNDRLERSELALEMEIVINKLPPQRMHAFELVYLQQKKYKEAAEEMGITTNSLKTHLKLAVKAFREKFLNNH